MGFECINSWLLLFYLLCDKCKEDRTNDKPSHDIHRELLIKEENEQGSVTNFRYLGGTV